MGASWVTIVWTGPNQFNIYGCRGFSFSMDSEPVDFTHHWFRTYIWGPTEDLSDAIRNIFCLCPGRLSETMGGCAWFPHNLKCPQTRSPTLDFIICSFRHLQGFWEWNPCRFQGSPCLSLISWWIIFICSKSGRDCLKIFQLRPKQLIAILITQFLFIV